MISAMTTEKLKPRLPSEIGALSNLGKYRVQRTWSVMCECVCVVLTPFPHFLMLLLGSFLVGLELIGMMPGVTIPAEYMHMTNLGK